MPNVLTGKPFNVSSARFGIVVSRYNENITGKLLGHSQGRTTERYAHVATDPAKAATERVGAAISGMMAGKTGEVVPIKERART